MRLVHPAATRMRRGLRDAAGMWRSALQELTWRRVLIAEALGLLFNVLRFLDGWGTTQHWVVRTFFTTVAPLLLVMGALAAAAAVRRGVPPLRSYAVALIAASSGSTGIQFILRQLLGVHPTQGDMVSSAVKEWTWIAADFQTVLLLGGIAFVAFYNHRSVERILQNIRAAELKHVRLENELVESRLATAQAQVDPRALFESLARIRNLFAASSPDADHALEELIQTLRTRRIATGAAVPPGGLGS